MALQDHYATPQAKKRLWAEQWLCVFRAGAWASGEPPLPPPISPRFDNYHPYACNGCKRGPFTGTRLFTCTQCRVVRYCSREHQKADWAQHKRWCKAFFTRRETDDYRALEKPTDIESWRLHSRRLSVTLNTMLGSRLHTSQSQVATMQPRCRQCLAAGCVQGVELVTCPRCHGVALCRDCCGGNGAIDGVTGEEDGWIEEEHAKFHVDGGQVECDGHVLALSCTGMVVEQGMPLCIESDTDVEECFQPVDWADYLSKKREDFHSVPPKPMMLMAPVVAFITDGLSLPLTTLFALAQPAVLGEEKVASLSRLVIHLVGSSANEELSINCFIELIRLLPALTYLRIVCIGPDLEVVASGFPKEGRALNFTDPDESPIRDSCDARLLRRTGYYHKVTAELEDEPTIVVACHSGIHDLNYTEHWRPTVKLLASKSIPCLFTGYNEKEILSDEKELMRCGAKIIVQPRASPFRGLRPFHDPLRSPSDFIHKNSYILVTSGYESYSER